MRSPTSQARIRRLTRSPALRSPSVLRASVSGTTSNATISPSTAVAVRQTPSIAIESLGCGALAIDALASHLQRNAPPPGCAFARQNDAAIGDESAKHANRSGNDDVVARRARMRSKRSATTALRGRAGKHRHRDSCRREVAARSPSRSDRPLRPQQAGRQPRTAFAQYAEDAALRAARSHCGAKVEPPSLSGHRPRSTSATACKPVEMPAQPAGASTIVFAYPSTAVKTRLAASEWFRVSHATTRT